MRQVELLLAFTMLLMANHAFAAPHNLLSENYGSSLKRSTAQHDSKREILSQQPAKSWENPVAGHSKVSEHLNNLGESYCILGKYNEAKPLFQQALAIDEKTYGPDSVDVARDLHSLAVLYQAQKRFAQAEPLYRRCLSIREKDYGPDHLLVAESLTNLARLYQDEGNLSKAEPIFKRVIAVYEGSVGPNNPLLADALDNYSKLLRKQKRTAEAVKLEARAKSIWSEQ